ncbi:vanadium-dependent haloperoxidase [Nakamurella sp. GG22]
MRPQVRLLLVLSLTAAMLVPLTGPVSAGGQARSGPAGSTAVQDWNATMTTAAFTCKLTDAPPIEARLYAMTQIAVHDALNAIDRRSEPYAYHPRVRHGASAPAAVAAAASTVLNAELAGCGAGLEVVKDARDHALRAIPTSAAKTAGVQLGTAAAKKILHKRSHDRAALQIADPTVEDFPQGTRPGEWRFTPGPDGKTLLEFAFLPKWGTVKTFALRNSDQFEPSGPYPLRSRAYARDFNEVKALGSTTSTRRTAEQTEIARFWVGSAPTQWNNIANTVSRSKGHHDMWTDARMFALLNMAMADGYIASFDTKFEVLFWRPVTAIRAASTDGNPWTRQDKSWTPLEYTPPIPDYESAHAVEGGAAAAVLARFFGDRTPFANCSPWLPDPSTACGGAVRHFRSFSQAADENAASRVYVGFHFRKGADDGNQRGDQIGNYTVRTALKVLHR